MDKIAFLYLSRLIKKFITADSAELFNNIHAVSAWLSESVSVIGRLGSFTIVQDELMTLADFIIQGKHVTPRVCLKLVKLLKQMQQEILDKFEIVVFVTTSIKLKFNKNVKVINVNNEDECVDLAYNLKNELKYLVFKDRTEVSEELTNAVDIVISFGELLEVADKCYPIDSFVYDRLYLKSRLNKLSKKESNILITGSSDAISMELDDKIINVCINNQDLYYSLLSVREIIKRAKDIDIIIISFPYRFLFSDITTTLSEKDSSFLSHVFYPVYNTVGKYKGEVLPLYIKHASNPVCEAIVNLKDICNIYHNAIISDLEKMEYYNDISTRKKVEYVEQPNKPLDLDKAMGNKVLLDRFLENMEELNKKVIVFVPPTTKAYRESLQKDLIGVGKTLISDVVNKYKNCKYINLFEGESFSDDDFFDDFSLNDIGIKKLSDIIEKHVVSS